MKLYDCFTFFNEFELLEMRLNLLYDIIDYFVIVEANRTHRNKEKPFFLENEFYRFKKFRNKIIYIKVSDMAGVSFFEDGECWSLENFQRNAITRGLQGCDPNDLILISDVDEIPNPIIFEQLMNSEIGTGKLRLLYDKRLLKKIARILKYPQLIKGKVDILDVLDKEPISLEQEFYYYFLNCKCRTKWVGTVMTRYKNLISPQYLRNRRCKFARVVNDHIGWHFSYLGGVEKIIEKVNAIVERPVENLSRVDIENALLEQKDLYGRKGNSKDEFQYDIVNIGDIPLKGIDYIVQKYPYLYLRSKK